MSESYPASTNTALLEKISSRPALARTTGGVILQQIIGPAGYGRAPLFSDEVKLLAEVRSESDDFFAAGPQVNLQHSVQKLTNGYRPPEAAYNNGDPLNESDQNDSFIYWNQELATQIPNHQHINGFLQAIEAYRTGPAARIMYELTEALDRLFEYGHPLPLDDASLLQINSFGQLSPRELLQTPHEDGVLATIIWTSAPGLEGVKGNVVTPLTPNSNEVFIMPGGILSLMTDNEILPYVHQARNHGRASIDRKSIMYFSNPDINKGNVEPYVVNGQNTNGKINSAIQKAVLAYGLDEQFFPSQPTQTL